MPGFVTADGSVIHFEDTGNGIPIIFIHGWMMSGAVWKYQQPLSGSFRIITPDLRGHGASETSGFSYAACSSDLVELIDHLALDRVILAGWSMGSQILLTSLPILKGRVAALLLVSGTPRFCLGDEYPHGIPVAETRSMRGRLLRNFERTAGEFFKGMFAPDEVGPSEYLELARNVTGRLPAPPIALAALDELIRTDLCNELHEIYIPALLMHGDRDTICPASASLFIHSRLRGSRLRIFAETGHAPFLTRATDFNRAVEEFAKEVYDRN